MNDVHFACLVEAFIADDIDDADRTLLSQAVANDPLRAEQFRQQVRVSMLVTAAIGPDRSDERLASIQHTITLERPSQILRIWGAVQKRTRMASRSRPRSTSRASSSRRSARPRASRHRTALGLVLAGTLAALIAAVMLIRSTPPDSDPQLAQPTPLPPASPTWQDNRGQRHEPGTRITAHQRLVLNGPQSDVLVADAGAVLDLPDNVTPVRLHAGRLELRSAYRSDHSNLAIETPHVRFDLIRAADALPSEGDADRFATEVHTVVTDGLTSVTVERGRIRATTASNDVRELPAGESLQAGDDGFQLPPSDRGMLSPTQWRLSLPPKIGHGQIKFTADPNAPARDVLRMDMTGDNLINAWMVAGADIPQARAGPPTAIRVRYWPIKSSPDTRFNVNVSEHDGDAWAIFEGPLIVAEGWLILDIPWQARYRLHHGGDGVWAPAQAHRLGIGMAKGAGSFLLDHVEFLYD